MPALLSIETLISLVFSLLLLPHRRTWRLEGLDMRLDVCITDFWYIILVICNGKPLTSIQPPVQTESDRSVPFLTLHRRRNPIRCLDAKTSFRGSINRTFHHELYKQPPSSRTVTSASATTSYVAAQTRYSTINI